MARSQEFDHRWAAGLAFALALLGQRAQAACDLTSLDIPVRLVNQRPIATLTLDGVEVAMLVDSGAFFSMLTEATAAQLKLKTRPLPGDMRIEGWTGTVDASLTKVSKVKLRDAVLPNVEFIVGINELGSGIGGVLGRNFLSAADTEYDLAHGVVRMMFPKGDCAKTNFAYWAGDAPIVVVPLEESRRDDDNTPRVTVRLNDSRAKAIMDTGAPATTIKVRAARRAGIEERDLTPLGTTGGGGSGRVKAWTAQFKTFELGGEKIANNRFVVDDVRGAGDDMLLGLDYFLSHRIYISRLQGKVYLTWNGGPVFAQTWSDTPLASTAGSPYAAAPAAIAADDVEALARRGAAAAARKDYTRALADLDRACELAPQNAGHLLARARVHVAMRTRDQAMADLDAALRLDPALHEARMLRANLRDPGDERAAVLADLAALDESLPPSAHLRADMAQLYAEMKLAPEALRQWDLWMPTHRSDAGLAQVLNSRCWLRAQLGLELDKALDDCKRAVRLAEVESAFHDSLGWTYLRLGEARQAGKAFDEALELKAASAWSLYGRSLALRSQGRVDAAERDLAAARKARPMIEDEVRAAGFTTAEGAIAKPGT